MELEDTSLEYQISAALEICLATQPHYQRGKIDMKMYLRKLGSPSRGSRSGILAKNGGKESVTGIVRTKSRCGRVPVLFSIRKKQGNDQ